MMTAFANALADRGVPRADIFREVFRSPERAAAGPDQQFNVVFAKSGTTSTWRSADGPLLGFAEKLGLALPSGCRVGQCESCLMRVVAGNVAQLGGDASATDHCLTCQSVPLSELTLAL